MSLGFLREECPKQITARVKAREVEQTRKEGREVTRSQVRLLFWGEVEIHWCLQSWHNLVSVPCAKKNVRQQVRAEMGHGLDNPGERCWRLQAVQR